MPSLNMILNAEAVNTYLETHKLEDGHVPIEAALIQYAGMESGQPAVLLTINVDGRIVLAKTSLQLMETMCAAMRAASGVPRDP